MRSKNLGMWLFSQFEWSQETVTEVAGREPSADKDVYATGRSRMNLQPDKAHFEVCSLHRSRLLIFSMECEPFLGFLVETSVEGEDAEASCYFVLGMSPRSARFGSTAALAIADFVASC